MENIFRRLSIYSMEKDRIRRTFAIKSITVVFLCIEIYNVEKIDWLTSGQRSSSVWGYLLEGTLTAYHDLGILYFVLTLLFLSMPLIASFLVGLRTNMALICICLIIILFAGHDINNIYAGSFILKSSPNFAMAALFHVGCIAIIPADRLIRFLSRNPDKWA